MRQRGYEALRYEWLRHVVREWCVAKVIECTVSGSALELALHRASRKDSWTPGQLASECASGISSQYWSMVSSLPHHNPWGDATGQVRPSHHGTKPHSTRHPRRIRPRCHDPDASGHGTCTITVCYHILLLSSVPFVPPSVLLPHSGLIYDNTPLDLFQLCLVVSRLVVSGL